jgi:hypothetical protein
VKANARIRDLRRRSKAAIRRYVETDECPHVAVTTMPWTRNAKGERVRVPAIREEARG